MVADAMAIIKPKPGHVRWQHDAPESPGNGPVNGSKQAEKWIVASLPDSYLLRKTVPHWINQAGVWNSGKLKLLALMWGVEGH